MKITFKNVGQGDSIILEWNRNGEDFSRIGIIDCKVVGGENPIIEHIKKINFNKKIDFIVLSHPHYDHYSGMADLLNWCEVSDIKINKFIASVADTPEILNWFEIDDEHCKLLAHICSKAIKLCESKLINSIGFPVQDFQYKLNEDFTLRCISPSGIENLNFIRQTKHFSASSEYRARQAANILSTVFTLESSGSCCLLTSDSSVEVIHRMIKRDNEYFQNFKILLCQIPHHGSIENHFMPFWENLTYDTNCPAIISAGEHKKYNHPHKQVVSDFHKNYYKVYSTNFINGMKDFYENDQEISEDLDSFTELVEMYDKKGDHSFLIYPSFAIQDY